MWNKTGLQSSFLYKACKLSAIDLPGVAIQDNKKVAQSILQSLLEWATDHHAFNRAAPFDKQSEKLYTFIMDSPSPTHLVDALCRVRHHLSSFLTSSKLKRQSTSRYTMAQKRHTLKKSHVQYNQEFLMKLKQKIINADNINNNSEGATVIKAVALLSMVLPNYNKQVEFEQNLLTYVWRFRLQRKEDAENYIYSKYIPYRIVKRYYKMTTPRITISPVPPSDDNLNGSWILIDGKMDYNFPMDPTFHRPSIASYLKNPGFLDCYERSTKHSTTRHTTPCNTAGINSPTGLDSLILVNPVTSSFYDPNGICQSQWKENIRPYPLNWLISPKMCNNSIGYDFSKGLPLKKLMGGNDTVLQKIQKMWHVTYKTSTAIATCHAVHVDDSTTTFIPPDIYHMDPNYNPLLHDHATQVLKIKQRLVESPSNRAAAKRFVKDSFHHNILQQIPGINDGLIWDGRDVDFQIWSMQQQRVVDANHINNHPIPFTLSSLSVRYVNTLKYGSLLQKCNQLGTHHIRRKYTSTRATPFGKMVGTGQHVARGQSIISSFKKDKDFDTEACSDLCREMAAYLETELPHQVIAMRAAERSFGLHPDITMGGELGVTASMDQSIDIGNNSHYDVGDASVSHSMWSETHPGTATNWWFVLNNVRVFHNGKTYDGLLIKLRHGTSIVWDGRVIRHCTSVTHIDGDNGVDYTIPNQYHCMNNHVFGTFFGAKANTIKSFLKQQQPYIFTNEHVEN